MDTTYITLLCVRVCEGHASECHTHLTPLDVGKMNEDNTQGGFGVNE
jgi:hypothetical protein